MPGKWSRIPLRDLKTYRASRAPRLPDCGYDADEIVHLTICAAHGEPFADADLAQRVCDSVAFYCERFAYRLFGHCLMPDHLHVLLSPNESGVSISKWLQAFKSFTGHAYVRQGGSSSLWQRSAHDHVCRRAETAEQVLAYIANNPVRAGLVECWQDWPWTRVCIEI